MHTASPEKGQHASVCDMKSIEEQKSDETLGRIAKSAEVNNYLIIRDQYAVQIGFIANRGVVTDDEADMKGDVVADSRLTLPRLGKRKPSSDLSRLESGVIPCF